MEVQYKTCVKCRNKHNEWVQSKRADVGKDQRCCTRCYTIGTISEYGEYEGVIIVDGRCENAIIPYTSCQGCRLKDTIWRGG